MTDKTDPNTLSPALAREFISGTLARIQQVQPEFYPYVMAAIHAQDPTFQLNGLFDSIGDIGSSLSSAIGSAASAYSNILVNRENAKTAAIIASDQAKNQIDVMNAQLKAQQAQTTNAFAQQQLALQQAQLLKTQSSLTGGGEVSPAVWVVGGVLALGLLFVAMKSGAH